MLRCAECTRQQKRQAPADRVKNAQSLRGIVAEVMTKPRISPERELMGLLGSVPQASRLQKAWNAFLREQGRDAFVDKYSCTTEVIPERLSEMYHFDRRWYIVAPALQHSISTHLDVVHDVPVTCILNKEGVLHGYNIDHNLLYDPKRVDELSDFITIAP